MWRQLTTWSVGIRGSRRPWTRLWDDSSVCTVRIAQREGVSYKILRNALFASLIPYRNELYIKKTLRNELCATLSLCAVVCCPPVKHGDFRMRNPSKDS